LRRKKKISLLRLQLRLDCNVEDVCIHIKLNSIKKFFMPESKHSPVFFVCLSGACAGVASGHVIFS